MFKNVSKKYISLHIQKNNDTKNNKKIIDKNKSFNDVSYKIKEYPKV